MLSNSGVLLIAVAVAVVGLPLVLSDDESAAEKKAVVKARVESCSG